MLKILLIAVIKENKKYMLMLDC